MAQSQVPNVTAPTSSDIEARFNFNAPPGEAISHHYRPRTASTVIEQERNDQELASFLERANIDADPAQEVAEIYQDARAYLQASQPINGVSVANIDPYLLGQENIQPGSDKYVAPLLADVQDEQVARYEDDYTEDQSLLTKGGYTTTMVTSIIEAPRIDTQAKKELLAAKATVDALKEVVELEEDEAWDPSMVSEYSEDIFLYMHMMEVSRFLSAVPRDMLTDNFPTGENASKSTLHGKPDRDTVEHEINLDGLACTGPSSLSATTRDFVPLRQLH